MTTYYNEKDLVKALKVSSKVSPHLYFYPISGFAEARIVSMKRLNVQAPTDCMILSYGRAYFKNGKRKPFSEKQIIEDQKVGWR